MTNSARGDATVAKRKGSEAPSSVRREVADLVRHCSTSDGRHGFRVIARGASGHIYFDRGRVVHAEFGEDCGLRAVVEMLRAGPVQLEAASTWPNQPSLHLGSELLLSITGSDASRVVRKVDLPVEPPPLPDPQRPHPAELGAAVRPEAFQAGGAHADALHSSASYSDALHSSASYSDASYSDAVRGGTKRPISGVMPRVVESVTRLEAGVAEPASSAPEASDLSSAARASRRSAALAASRLAASVAVSERSLAKAAGQPSPLPPPVATRPAVDPQLDAAPAGQRRAPSELPITRAQRARSRSIVVARTSPAPASARTASVSPASPSSEVSSPETSLNPAVAPPAPSAPKPAGAAGAPRSPQSPGAPRSPSAASAPLSKSPHSAAPGPKAPHPFAAPPAVASPPRASQNLAAGSQPEQRPAPKRESPGKTPVPRVASKPLAELQPTTMVRIAARGDLLAARGKNAEQLAEAAAFIHGVANLIAADFGRHGRANVHLSGGGMSLLVARSEVNDIAAALGPTERLTSLLGKVGLK